MFSNALIKKMIASVYETETFSSFLNNVLHPGGLALTSRLAEIAHIDHNSSVLDIGCGKGESSSLLVSEYDCCITGIDLSERNISIAIGKAKGGYLEKKTKFIIADAEDLPFRDSVFDIVTAECSFSILLDKAKAAQEIERVLKPGGTLVLVDITLKSQTCSIGGASAPNVFPLIPCISLAQSAESYMEIFLGAGLINPYIENHSLELKKIGYKIGITFGSWEKFLHALSEELCHDTCFEKNADVGAVENFSKLLSQSRVSFSLIKVIKPYHKQVEEVATA